MKAKRMPVEVGRMNRMLLAMWVGILCVMMVGCAPEMVEPPTAREIGSTTADVPVVTPVERSGSDTTASHSTAASAPVLPTVTNSPLPVLESSPTPTNWTQTAGVEGDYYVLGNPNAPIRLIDYSDFM